MSTVSADPLGKMTLRDDFVPGLQAGRYLAAAQHSIHPEDSQIHYARSLEFVVSGPRFTLGSDDIHACSPPPSATGDYTYLLPHIVLRKRALPWERLLVPEEGAKAGEVLTPWLALLVLTHEELQAPGAGVSTTSVADLQIGVESPTASKTVTEPSGKTTQQTVLLPKLDDEEDDPTINLQVLDLPKDLFLQICPRVSATNDDLRLLAHVRQVDTVGKVPLKMHADGEFSVMLANRFPPNGSITVHLVSLEGWHSLLAGTDRTGDLVRLVTLYNWSFVNDEKGVHTFQELVQTLDIGVLGDPETDLADGWEALDDLDPARQPLQYGYRPVDYLPRNSDRTFAWYRGPLSPVQVTPLPGDGRIFQLGDAI